MATDTDGPVNAGSCRHRRRRGVSAALFIAAIVITCAACGSTAPASSRSPTPAAHAANQTPDVISESTKMICAPEAQREISTALGARMIRPPAPTWMDHRYSCAYIFANGTLDLSVKQLRNAASARRYVASLATRLGRRQRLAGLGQGAFTTANDSVVVSKDNEVLVVDAQGLPARFGVPPEMRKNVAVSVAVTIMGCWTGA